MVVAIHGRGHHFAKNICGAKKIASHQSVTKLKKNEIFNYLSIVNKGQDIRIRIEQVKQKFCNEKIPILKTFYFSFLDNHEPSHS